MPSCREAEYTQEWLSTAPTAGVRCVCVAEDADIADKAHRWRVTPPSRRLRDNPSRADNGGLLRLWQMPPESRMPPTESGFALPRVPTDGGENT